METTHSTAMEGECKVLLDTTVEPEARKHTTESLKPSSKLTMALLAFTLCLAATAAAVLVFNTHAKGLGPDEVNSDLHHALRHISNVRAAIHLKGEHNPDVRNSVAWEDDVDQSHSQGGLKLDNNEIVIPQNGIYFVYSQASFRVRCSSNNPDDTTSNSMVHLSHTVERWSMSYGNNDSRKTYRPILHSIRTACQKTTSSNQDEDGNWFSAVYMGAVFNLRRGDRLRTVMEEKMLLNLEDGAGKTFFGVFAL